MKKHTVKREEARRLYLTGECEVNAEIAARLGVKAHTVGRWRKDEDWDGLRLKIDRKAAEMFVEKIATDRMTLNVRHYRLWDLLLARLGDALKSVTTTDIRELERIATVVERSQRGQRLAKGLSTTGDAEETIRAQAEADIRRMVDSFIDAVKENVPDEETREGIRQSILAALPGPEADGAGESGRPVA